MTTKARATKKPAKATRQPRQPKPTTEEIGRSIGDALGRRLEDLLQKPDNPRVHAVTAWTAEKLGNRVMAHCAAEPSPIAEPTDVPPVSDALDRIAFALNCADSITQIEHRKLEKYLLPAPANKDGCGASFATRGLSDFVRALNEVADRIFADNDARRNILDRLEI